MHSLAPHNQVTYDSSIHYLGTRWAINTTHEGRKNVRGIRTRHLQRCIDLQLYMLSRFGRVLEVRLESHSNRYDVRNNIEWLKTRDKFLEKVQSRFGVAVMAWFRERGDESDYPHYHAVIWLNGHDVQDASLIQSIWEKIHHDRDHAIPFDWERSRFEQSVMLHGKPKAVSDYAYRCSYICKVSTKSACSGGYDFGCSHVPLPRIRTNDINSGEQ